MWRDPKKYFGFTFDESTELVYNTKNRPVVIDTTICETAGHGFK